jgi:hypothetical protein
MINSSELGLTLEDHEKAFTEVSFLIDILFKTIEVFVGKSSPSLPVVAGRKMARVLPVHMNSGSPEEALKELVRVLSAGLDISGRFDENNAVISLRHCPIRDVCKERGLTINGQACNMFHYYMAGIMAELTGRPNKPITLNTGDECSFKLAFG